MTDDELDRLRNNILSALIILRDQTDQVMWLDKRVLANKMSHPGPMSDLIAAVGSLMHLGYVETDRDIQRGEALQDFSIIRLTSAGLAFFDHGNRFVAGPAGEVNSDTPENPGVPENAIVTESGDFLVTENGDYLVTESRSGASDRSIRVDSAAWTGLIQRATINARNAKVIGGLIEQALTALPEAGAGNFENMQAAAYLKAAKELVDAPEPPSELIWQLISKAADLVGLIGLFYTIFSQAAQ